MRSTMQDIQGVGIVCSDCLDRHKEAEQKMQRVRLCDLRGRDLRWCGVRGSRGAPALFCA